MRIFDNSHWLPPQRPPMVEWIEQNYFLSAESAAEEGRFRPYPYQRGIIEAIGDPKIGQVSWMKSARVGATKLLNGTIGYYMAGDPCPIMVVQPTVEDAEGYSKEELTPMIRDSPALARIFGRAGTSRDSSDTILHKTYPGGSISIVGANSGRGFRRVSRKVILLDEVDAYPPSAGSDGDPVTLAIRRAEWYADRKIVAASTPLVEGTSRIARLFLDGDQRHYHVPCPHCGTYDVLVFRKKETHGHYMQWPDGKPEQAHFVCGHCSKAIEANAKRDMFEAGKWIAEAPFTGHASFHIWAAYSYAANASWGQIATEFSKASKAGPEQLRVVINTLIGETWQEQGDAPDWERLYHRREDYTAPGESAVLLTAGVDVQHDRLEYEVVAWAPDLENWSIATGELYGDTAGSEVWEKLDALLATAWPWHNGEQRKIDLMAVDSGDRTQYVYNWCRKYPISQVVAVKGDGANLHQVVSSARKIDVTVGGRSVGYKLFRVGTHVVKTELVGHLKLTANEDGTYPPGYCHHPEYGPEYFKQLCAEHLVQIAKRTGHAQLEWRLIPGRQNHKLDCRVYARAAASLRGIDRGALGRAAPAQRRTAPAPQAPTSPAAQPRKAPAPQPAPPAPAPPAPAPRKPSGGGWLNGGGRRGGWL